MVASGRHLVIENHTKILLFRQIVGVVFNLVLNYMLIPAYGPIGAAVSTLISYFFLAFVSNYAFKESRIISHMFLKSFDLRHLLNRSTHN